MSGCGLALIFASFTFTILIFAIGMAIGWVFARWLAGVFFGVDY